MRIVDKDKVIYIINDFDNIVLAIPYYDESDYCLEIMSPYSHNKEEAMSFAEAIIEEFY